MEHSVIDYIYVTNQTVNEKVKENKEFRKASERALKFYDKLNGTLTDGQKDYLERFIENEVAQTDIMLRAAFKCGIKYGVRFVAEGMFD